MASRVGNFNCFQFWLFSTSRAPAAAALGGVAVQELAPAAASRRADPVVLAHDGSEVEDGEDRIPAVLPEAQQRQDAVERIANVDPLESAGRAVALEEGRTLAVEAVQVRQPAQDAPEQGLLQQVPGEAGSTRARGGGRIGGRSRNMVEFRRFGRAEQRRWS